MSAEVPSTLRKCSKCESIKEKTTDFRQDSWTCDNCIIKGATSVATNPFKAAKPSYANSVLDIIGNTPLVKLNKVTEGTVAAKVLVKLEMQNPGGSLKDRIALSMIEDAEAKGIITPGKTTVVECTSGNTGIAVAMVCAAKGYRCIIVMPQKAPMRERVMICRMFGAEVHLTCEKLYVAGLVQHTQELLKLPDHWCPWQFENQANPQIHMDTTAEEIWQQTDGEVDVVLAGAGTGGTITGLAQALKAKKPTVCAICIEPTESRVLVGEDHKFHTLVGMGAGVPLPFIQALAPDQPWQEGPRGIIDEFLHASSEEAIHFARRLAREEGLLVGPSSGAVVKVALDVAKRPESRGKTIVAVLASSGIRYTNHPLWEDKRSEVEEALNVGWDLEPEPVLRWVSAVEAHPKQ